MISAVYSGATARPVTLTTDLTSALGAVSVAPIKRALSPGLVL